MLSELCNYRYFESCANKVMIVLRRVVIDVKKGFRVLATSATAMSSNMFCMVQVLSIMVEFG